MHKLALAYAQSQRICVIALEMMDGAPHAATVHYANTGEPVFVFETDRNYRKSEPLLSRKTTRASVVIGTNEGDMKTLQMDGVAALITADHPLHATYLEKFPEKAAKAADPNALYFSFTPTWWRYTDWTLPEGKTVFTAE